MGSIDYLKLAQLDAVVTPKWLARRYYNLLDFALFEFIQADVKVIVTEKNTLPDETYLYSKELVKGVSAFIVSVVLCLRSFGIKVKITIQTD